MKPALAECLECETCDQKISGLIAAIGQYI